MGHTFSNLLVHVVFSTKGRRHDMYKAMREPLLSYICGVGVNEEVKLLCVNALAEHVHLLLRIKPSHNISMIVNKLKANSSRWIHQTYPDLQLFEWQPGFSAFSVSESAAGDVMKYIERQEEHHQRVSFGDELKLFLEKNKVGFHPEHYLD
jgi:putative transposase